MADHGPQAIFSYLIEWVSQSFFLSSFFSLIKFKKYIGIRYYDQIIEISTI